jgi:hypothetical protein
VQTRGGCVVVVVRIVDGGCGHSGLSDPGIQIGGGCGQRGSLDPGTQI